MTRWDLLNCQNPGIFMDATTSLPSCRSCGSTPDLEKLLGEQQDHNPFPTPPPDEPQGQMDLWWPPSVPYIGESTRSGSFLEQEETAEEVDDPASSSVSFIYPDKLEHMEFRLACITSSPDHNQPVHLDLEKYSVDNCPEYETVSYTWGGEDGDNTKKHPVFIGPFWDVSFQARNCWELLRFVRPRRGIRLMWIDAICINQQNDFERGRQVSMMGSIYRRCMQVVVYLGPGVAWLLPSGQYPKRASLESIEDFQFRHGLDGLPVFHHNTASLVRRRYFYRLWVVQELLLASRVLMRVEDIDFWADRASSQDHRNEEGINWVESLQHTEAPWMKHVACGGLSTGTLGIDGLLQLTRHAQCADPRDRIFGLTGILQNVYFQANYALSCQHVYIGVFADLMIRGQRYGLLEFGSGASDRSPSLSSWVPEWRDWSQWSIIVEPEYFYKYHTDQSREASLRTLIEYLHGEQTRVPLSRRMFNGTATILCPIAVTRNVPVSSDAPTTDTSNTDRNLGLGHSQVDVTFAIDRSNGNLHAKIARLCTLQTRPELIHRYERKHLGIESFVFEFKVNRLSLYLTSRHRLDRLVLPGKDTLYLSAFRATSDWPQILVLRMASDATNTYRLIASCDGILFASEDKFPSFDSTGGEDLVSALGSARYWTIDKNARYCRFGPHFVSRLTFSLVYLHSETKAWLHSELDPMEKLLYLWAQHHKDILPLYQAVARLCRPRRYKAVPTHGIEPSLLCNTLISAYTRCLSADSTSSQPLPYTESDNEIYFSVPSSPACSVLHQQNVMELQSLMYFATTDRLERPDRSLFEPVLNKVSNWSRELNQFPLVIADHPKEKDGGYEFPFVVLRFISAFIFNQLSQRPGSWLVYMVRLAETQAGRPQDELLLDWCSRDSVLTDDDKLISIPAGDTARILMEGFGITGSIEEVIIS